MKPLRYAVCVSVALFCLPLQAGAKFITFQPPGATDTVSFHITNRGEVIGQFSDPSGTHGFIRAADGTFTIIDAHGDAATISAALAKDGTIVGYYASYIGRWAGFIRTPDGQFSDLVAPHGKIATYPISLSKAGWIAGWGESGTRKRPVPFGFLRDPQGHYAEFAGELRVSCANSGNTIAGVLDGNGFVRTPDGTITQFAPAGAVYTYASAINDAGTVTGSSDFSSNTYSEGFIRASDGTISTFAVPGENVQYTYAESINKSGVVAGWFQNRDLSAHGFIRASDGTITPIDVPGGGGTEINGINDKGEAAGDFFKDGTRTGFIWKP